MDIILGLHGKARSGKNQFADYLQECFLHRHRRSFVQMAFAAELKKMCQEHFDLSYDQLWGDNKEKPDMRYLKNAGHRLGISSDPNDYWTAREIMQELGSFYRKMHYDFWVDYLGKQIKKRGVSDVIITDVRHVNEGNFIKNNKGVLIKIIRPDANEIHGMTHESETALDGMSEDYFDIIIDNSGTLEDLHKAAEDTSDAVIVLENTIKLGRIEIHGD